MLWSLKISKLALFQVIISPCSRILLVLVIKRLMI